MSEGYPRRLSAGQRCRVLIGDLEGRTRVVFETGETLFEAPNWAPDGHLVLNAEGRLFDLVPGGRPVEIRAEGLPAVNNDHVLSPDGATILASGDDGQLHRVSRAGGKAQAVTHDAGVLHFLHGISPDGTQLAYVAIVPGQATFGAEAHLRLIGADGTGDRELTTTGGPDDGPEFSPDGRWIYFNTETFTPGQMQVARIRPDGTEPERLTHDDRVDWFPHVSPTGSHAVFLSYPTGTHAHPADLPVQLRIVEMPRFDDPIAVIDLFGGQGTINVTSWSPDGREFAYVDYPME